VSPNVYGYVPSIRTRAPEPELARDLLRQAGYGGGIELEMEYPHGTTREASEIRSDLAQAGITLKTTQRPWANCTHDWLQAR